RDGSEIPKNGSGHRAHYDCKLPDRFAIWAQRCCSCLLCGNDLMDHSGDCLVCARNRNFGLGCIADGKPTFSVEHRRCRAGFHSAIALWSIVVSSAPTCARKWGTFYNVCYDALLCNWPESVLYGSLPFTKQPYGSRGEQRGFGFVARACLLRSNLNAQIELGHDL